jgi:hypothetical protein
MPVSGVGSSGVNYPAQPPTNGVSAYSLVMLGSLANIAGSLVGNSQDVENAKLQAIADLAKIHLYLTGANPDQQAAKKAATDFLKLNQKYNFSDSTTTTLYTEASNYFKISRDGVTVTGFKADSKGVQFSEWWANH